MPSVTVTTTSIALPRSSPIRDGSPSCGADPSRTVKSCRHKTTRGPTVSVYRIITSFRGRTLMGETATARFEMSLSAHPLATRALDLLPWVSRRWSQQSRCVMMHDEDDEGGNCRGLLAIQVR